MCQHEQQHVANMCQELVHQKRHAKILYSETSFTIPQYFSYD